MNTQQGYLLVVEDIPDILTLLDTTLKLKGYRVVTARNGQEALEAMERERPAMVITDILMPKLDGFGLIHRVRINPDTRDIPVIFITATYVASEDKEFALNIGATRFLEKPIDLDQFQSVVAELLAQGIHTRVEPFDELDFYEGYRNRLEAKLNHKIAQIARIEHLLVNPDEVETEESKAALRASLHQAISEQDEIENLLAQVNEHFGKNIKPK
jgi:CheY-like chemotaxis protein